MKQNIEVREVIVSSLTTKGNGQGTPFRRVLQVFEKDGTLIAENDPMPDEWRESDVLDFARSKGLIVGASDLQEWRKKKYG